MAVRSTARRVGREGLARVLAALAGLGLLLVPQRVLAHPMGNFSISHYAGIRLEPGFVEIQYLIDMAEIPTFQEMQKNAMPALAGDARVQVYLTRQAELFLNDLFLTLDGSRLQFELVSRNVLFAAGAGNLPTMKLGLVYRAQLVEACANRSCRLEYRDDNYLGRAGWKEIIATAGRGVTLERSSVPSQDRSSQLSDYPTDPVDGPPQDLVATVVFSTEASFTESLSTRSTAAIGIDLPPARPLDGPAPAPEPSRGHTAMSVPHPSAPEAARTVVLAPNRQATPRNQFTELMAEEHFGFGVALLAAAIAAGLGALHALEPGHGKTIVAAYLVGSRGTVRHAVLLGTIVTVSHTAGVYLLGGITLYAQQYVLPDRIYPFLGVLSGLLIAGTGCYLFLERYLGADYAHSHKYEGAAFSEARGNETPEQGRRVHARQLLALGVSGGIIPCPAALVVLLSAVALHRTGFGLFLIVAFSLGLAFVLIAMGVFAVYAGRLMARVPVDAPFIQRWLPMASAAMIVVLGCVITARGLMAAGILRM